MSLNQELAELFQSLAALMELKGENQFKVIGLNGPTPASIHDEVPFWRKTITEASKGAITADITPLDQMGIDDKTMLRLLKLGVMDFAAMDISKMAGDDPRFEGCDLAGLFLLAGALRRRLEDEFEQLGDPDRGAGRQFQVV